MSTQVFAFAKIYDEDARLKVYEQIKQGKSRFGIWDQKTSLKAQYHGKNGFLLRIKKGDWIVHINSPHYGRCVAVQATGEYGFDEGVQCSWGNDFNNFIPVDPSTMVEFDRKDPNVVPSVNLAPMKRGQRVLQVDDFLRTLDNLRQERFSSSESRLRGLVHLRERVDEELLPRITQLIHQMNRSKEFERFLHQVFEAMPNTVAIQNGFGWKSDKGADLIVEFQTPVIGVNLTSKLVVQAKSYEGHHHDLNAVSQLIEAIEAFEADGALLITTAEKTEQLEDQLQKATQETGKSIDLIAGNDVARFVIRYGPEMLVGV